MKQSSLIIIPKNDQIVSHLSLFCLQTSNISNLGAKKYQPAIEIARQRSLVFKFHISVDSKYIAEVENGSAKQNF